MNEAVEILIKADDQASATLAVVANNAEKSGKKTADAFKNSGQNVKAATDLFAQLANITGNSELAGLANTVGGVTEKVGQFSQVAKKGAVGAMGFKLGLMGLAATAGFAVGKALADIIWKTEKFERAMAQAKETGAELDAQLKRNASTLAANAREDIELIRNPEEKRAAYAKLLSELNRDIQTAADVAGKSARDVEEWADAWQITGNRKQYALDAQEQLKTDTERLANLKEQRNELMKVVGARGLEVEKIKAANAAKDKSEHYLETLRQEVEYMQATREEQIKIDALRNTTSEDQGEAERLLKERDAIKAKQEAEREAAEEHKKQQEEAIRAAEKAAEDAERARQKAQEDREKEAEKIAENARQEVQRVEDIISAERERMELQKIEMEQGAEAARVQELISQGVDETTAKQLAAEQAAIDLAKQAKADAAAKLKGEETGAKKTGGAAATLAASESRLLTRGSGSDPMEKTNKILEATQKHTAELAKFNAQQLEAQNKIADNTSKGNKLVPVA